MALAKSSAFRSGAFAFLLIVAGCTAPSGWAWAQYWGDNPSGSWSRPGGWGWSNRPSGGWGDRYPYERSYRPPNRDFFYPFSGERHSHPAPAADYSKAPPSRKSDTPPSRKVVVIGDSMADWLGFGLDEKYADHPEIGVDRKIRPTSGLIQYDAKNVSLDWPQAIKETLTNEKPNAIVVMLGLNDRVPLREKGPTQPKKGGGPAPGANEPAGQTSQDKGFPPADTEAPQAVGQRDSQQSVPGRQYDFHTDQWAALYGKRIDAMIAALKSTGVPVIWVGLPALRGTKATSDISYLDGLYREHAERAGITFVDIWDGFVDEDGDYAVQGPDFEGQIRRLRTADGVHFTKAGAVKVASYVDRELQRVMQSSVAPVALPAEATPKSGSAGARPDVGPVLPLTGSSSEHGGELLGAESPPSPTTSDPIAAKILSRGETLAPRAGRADDFSWPQGSDMSAMPGVSQEPAAAAAPNAPQKQGMVAKSDSKGQDNKKEPKEKQANKARRGYYNYYPGHWQRGPHDH